MTTAILEVLARLVPFAIGWFLIGAILAWRTRHERAALRTSVVARPDPANPYRSAPAAISAEDGSPPREAWDAGVRAERARVLTIVAAVKGATKDTDVQRACDAIVAGIEGGR